MNHRIAIVCLAIALLLAGCQLVPSEYVSVAPHTDSFSQPDGEETTVVADYAELQSAMLDIVKAGEEEAVLTANAYEGDIEADVQKAKDYITKTDPDGAYLVGGISEEIVQAGGYSKLDLQIHYQHMLEELAQAQDVRGGMEIENAIVEALKNCAEGLLLRISDYEPMEFDKVVAACCEKNITTVMAKPKVEAEVYPDQGSVRLVEFQFQYPHPLTVLERMQEQVDIIMQSGYGQSELDQARRMYAFLSELHDYTIGSSDTPAYSLLHEGVANSQSFAAVFSAMCSQAGLTCHVVHGKKDEAPYDWNILELDAGTWHVDAFADEQNGLWEMQLLTDAQMFGYEWDTEAYPACAGAPVPPEPVAAGQPPVEDGEEPQPEPPEVPEPEPQPDEPEQKPEDTQPPEENPGDSDISA